MKNPAALKVLIWSRGWLVTLQILTSSSFSLVDETHGPSGQCVSFFLTYVGSGFTAYIVFDVGSVFIAYVVCLLFSFFEDLLGQPALRV